MAEDELYKFMRKFRDMPIAEVKVIDRLRHCTRLEINLSDFAKEMGKDISNEKRVLLELERKGIIGIERNEKKKKQRPITAIYLKDGWIDELIKEQSLD